MTGELALSRFAKSCRRSRKAEISQVPGLDETPLSLVDGGNESDIQTDQEGSNQQSSSKISSMLAESNVLEFKRCLNWVTDDRIELDGRLLVSIGLS